MADLSIFRLDSETITIKDTTARQTADSAKTLATTASGNATTALNKINELESEISSLKSDLANHSALHVLPLSDIADAQNGLNIQSCKVAIQGKIVLCWLSFELNTSIPQWNNFAIAKLKSGYYPAFNQVGIIQEQMSGLTGAIRVADNAIYINPHGISFDPPNWCWGFVAYVLA